MYAYLVATLLQKLLNGSLIVPTYHLPFQGLNIFSSYPSITTSPKKVEPQDKEKLTFPLY